MQCWPELTCSVTAVTVGSKTRTGLGRDAVEAWMAWLRISIGPAKSRVSSWGCRWKRTLRGLGAVAILGYDRVKAEGVKIGMRKV